jgi:hypothetical protein
MKLEAQDKQSRQYGWQGRGMDSKINIQGLKVFLHRTKNI